MVEYADADSGERRPMRTGDRFFGCPLFNTPIESIDKSSVGAAIRVAIVGMVVDVWDFDCRSFPAANRHDYLVWPRIVLGVSRIHYDDANAPRRSPGIVLELGGIHAIAVRAHWVV